MLQQQLSNLSPNQIVSSQIQGTLSSTEISGEAIYLPQLHMTILNIKGLPLLAGTEVYQGWGIKNNHPSSIGLLNIEGGTATLDFPGDLRAYHTIAVSREPGPQASQGEPRGPIVATGTLLNQQGLIPFEPQLSVTSERRAEE